MAVVGVADHSAGADDAQRLQEVLPAATRFGGSSGEPPAIPAYDGNTLIGYAFYSRIVAASVGYSGKPLNVLVGLDLAGRITGVRLVEHHEPILVIGVSDNDLSAFVDQYRGHDIREPMRVTRDRRSAPGVVNAVAGATISSIVLNDTILQSARAVARSRGLLGASEAAFEVDALKPASWNDLLADGSIVHRRVSVGDASAALAAVGGRLPSGEPPPADETFIDLYLALATPPFVGRNLLGERRYTQAVGRLSAGDQLVFIAASGLYSFKGTGYVRGGVFDRIQIVENARTFALETANYEAIESVPAAGAPELREAALFVLPKASGFDPLVPWRLDLLIGGEGGGGERMSAVVALDYRLPDRFLSSHATAEPATASWREMWRTRIADVAILTLALLVLSAVLVFQDALARRAKLYTWFRTGFLVFTVVWIGWYAGAQLSVINVLTFAESLRTQFRWDYFLLEPLIFVLWGYVALALLFWGRGVFCGWLCPFGALQELLNRVAQRLKVPQLRLPFAIHERLWPLKYITFMGLFALSLGDTELTQAVAEIEPFKTAIVLRFVRHWPYVVYAAALLGSGLLVERFFCRYVCPLGAALALPARLRMFEWLKRRWQCGLQCQVCANRCPVQSIHPDGRINPNECIHCLNCQVIYFDDTTCPPLVERRTRQSSKLTQRIIERYAAAEAAQRDSAGGKAGKE
ncbi:MAG: 4Fe-4S binding protein [Alphaproteobacteria bacterium]